jgi:group I intron endonuclease
MIFDLYKIYVVTNLLNGKMYVGQTIQKLLRRWRQHRSSARTKRLVHFHHAINKYGEENFRIDCVAFAVTKEYADWLEKQWIVTLRTHLPEYGYNSTYGGEGARHTPEIREKISKARMGMPGPVWTPEQCAEIGLRQKGEKGNNWGKTASDETRRKMSFSHSGEKNVHFGKLGTEHPAFGAKHSEESKKSRSEKLKGRPGKSGEENPFFGKTHTPETKQLLSDMAKKKFETKPNPFRGKKHTEETKTKMRAAWDARRKILGNNP